MNGWLEKKAPKPTTRSCPPMCHACPRCAMLHAPCRANTPRRAMRMWTDLLGSRRSAKVQKRCRSVGPSPRSARPTHSEPPRAARGARLATAPGLLEAERRPEAARALAAWGGASPGPEPVIDVGLSWWVPKLCWFGPKNGPFCFRGGLSPTPREVPPIPSLRLDPESSRSDPDRFRWGSQDLCSNCSLQRSPRQWDCQDVHGGVLLAVCQEIPPFSQMEVAENFPIL